MRPEEQAPAPVEPEEAQVIAGLRGLYAAETQEMTRALERGRERLAQSQPGWLSSHHDIGGMSDHLRLPPDQTSTSTPTLQRFFAARRWSARLSSLVATALLVVLAGSLITGLILVRYTTSRAGGVGTATPQPGAIATNAPAQLNLYLLTLHDGWITKVDPTTKTVLWTYMWHAPSDQANGGGGGFGRMMAGDGAFYFSASTGQDGSATSLYALDAQSGKLRWQLQKPAGTSVVLIAPGVIYTVADDGLYALNANDGSVRWHTSLAGVSQATDLVLANGILYSAFPADGSSLPPTLYALYALNANDGTLLWKAPLPGRRSFTTISAVVNGTLLLTSGEEKIQANGLADPNQAISYAYAFSLDGKQLWQSQPFDGSVGGLTVVGGIIYSGVGLNDGSGLIVALNAKNGTTRWQYQTGTGKVPIKGPMIANGTVLVESGPMNSDSPLPFALIALDSQSGAVRWQHKLDFSGDQLAHTWVLANGMLYLLMGMIDPTSSLTAFNIATGAPLWQWSLGSAFDPIISVGA